MGRVPISDLPSYEIKESPLRPEWSMKPHHVRHVISGVIVFMMGIGANELIFHLRTHQPKRVKWMGTGEVETNYLRRAFGVETNNTLEIGITDDSIVWRPSKQK